MMQWCHDWSLDDITVVLIEMTGDVLVKKIDSKSTCYFLNYDKIATRGTCVGSVFLQNDWIRRIKHLEQTNITR